MCAESSSTPAAAARPGGPLRVGMYAHHHGSGHGHRCRSIAAELTGVYGAEVCVFSSQPGADVQLPLDTPDAAAGGWGDPEGVADATAQGTLHWAPFGVPGLSQRMARIASWVVENRPDVFYVDVSVEVAVLVRLLGVPVVHIAMPGERGDAPHQLAYAQASALIAAWPDTLPTPDHLRAHARRLHPVGGISRFDATTLPHPSFPMERESARSGDKTVVVMQGQGGTSWTPQYWRAVDAASPGWTVRVLGGDDRVDNPIPVIASSDVVVSAAGQNSVADIGLTTTPAIVVPQQRPFGEQVATARALEQLGAAVVVNDLPAPEGWLPIFERVCGSGSVNGTSAGAGAGAGASTGAGGASIGDVWNVRGAAGRAAAVIAECAVSPGRVTL